MPEHSSRLYAEYIIDAPDEWTPHFTRSELLPMARALVALQAVEEQLALCAADTTAVELRQTIACIEAVLDRYEEINGHRERPDQMTADLISDIRYQIESAPQEDGWTPLQFYAYIVRTLGLPARFHFDGSKWVGEAPFTKPVPQSILDLLEAQGV